MPQGLSSAGNWPLLLLLCWGALIRAHAEEGGSCAAGEATCGHAATALTEKPPHGQRYYWPQQKGDVNRTGRSPYTMPFDISGGPTWSWREPHNEVMRHTPLIDERRNIYLGTGGGRAYKFGPDGEMLWQHQAGAGMPAVPALSGGKFIYNLKDGSVVALDMETGAEQWRQKISNSTGSDTACLFVVEDLVISNTESGGNVLSPLPSNNLVVALRVTHGSIVWTFKHEWPTFNFQASAPGDGTMVFMDRAGGIYRLRLEDGLLIWMSGIPDRDWKDFTTGAAVVGPNDIVYAASNYRNMGIIHAYRLSDGFPVWRREMGMPVNQAVTVGKVAGSDRLHVAAGIGENPEFPFFIRVIIAFVELDLSLLVLLLCCGGCLFWRGKSLRYCRCFCSVGLPVLLSLEAGIASAGHFRCFEPQWFCMGHFLPAAFVALDAETGSTRWSYIPPPFSKPACEGDDVLLFPRLYNMFFKQPAEFGDPVCLPDNWAQSNLDAAGTAYGGHQDGYLYAIRDEDGSGTIEPEREVKRYYFGHAFQASQGMAPGMLAVVPCGGGLHVWRF